MKVIPAILIIVFFAVSLPSVAQSMDADVREAFVISQDAYLKQLNLSFYQNKEYQIITRNADKQEMKIQLSNMPAGMKKKKIKKVRRDKNKMMKELLNSQQYKLYLKRQKVIEDTLTDNM